jgi:flagellar hook-length control protein FliK
MRLLDCQDPGGIAGALLSLEVELTLKNQQQIQGSLRQLINRSNVPSAVVTAAITDLLQSGCATTSMLQEALAALRDHHAAAYPAALVEIVTVAFRVPQVRSFL